MKGKPKKSPREKDITSRFKSGDMDEDDDQLNINQRFSSRSKHMQENKTLKTSIMRAEELTASDTEALPIGQVTMVFSRYCEIEYQGATWLCQMRKTMTKTSGGDIVVGDFVRFRDTKSQHESGRPEAIIEQMLLRKTVLTRSDSFKQIISHPIVANAEQMLIVASLHEPDVKWGLIDRMIISALTGGLAPIVCLNKVDLKQSPEEDEDWIFSQSAMAHYGTLGIRCIETSITLNLGIDALRDILQTHITVLSGHSGVGKSSLIRHIQPSLDLRVGEISGYTGKGRHTTTSARRYNLDIGGQVIDTPGVKMFGLWGVTKESLADYFPDIATGTAPPWRLESYERIKASLND